MNYPQHIFNLCSTFVDTHNQKTQNHLKNTIKSMVDDMVKEVMRATILTEAEKDVSLSRKIDAIKMVRNRTGISLQEANKLVGDYLKRHK